MMCNETHEEHIQYAATVKHEYRNFKPKKLMIPSDNRKWTVLYGSWFFVIIWNLLGIGQDNQVIPGPSQFICTTLH